MFMKFRTRMKGEKGFTLIELLVVIIIIAILAAIAIPTFLGQRQKAQDAAAKSLVRNAMTAVESAYVDARTYNVTQADLAAIEPSIQWNVVGTQMVDTTPAVSASATATTKTNTVDYWGGAAVPASEGAGVNTSVYAISTNSQSGNIFGVYTNIGTNGGTTFVKELGTTVSTGW